MRERSVGDRVDEAGVAVEDPGLGVAVPDRAVASYREALELIRGGDRYYEATILAHLGDTYEAIDSAEARAVWQQALDILDELGHPDAEDVRRKLERQAAEDRAREMPQG